MSVDPFRMRKRIRQSTGLPPDLARATNSRANVPPWDDGKRWRNSRNSNTASYRVAR